MDKYTRNDRESVLMNSAYWLKTQEAEQLFLDRTMTRNEYGFWCEVFRSDINWLSKLDTTGEFYNHLIRTIHTDYRWTGYEDKFLYYPVSEAYQNYLGNLICDYASDQVDPDQEFMRAYENKLTEWFHETYPDEPRQAICFVCGSSDCIISDEFGAMCDECFCNQ